MEKEKEEKEEEQKNEQKKKEEKRDENKEEDEKQEDEKQEKGQIGVPPSAGSRSWGVQRPDILVYYIAIRI